LLQAQIIPNCAEFMFEVGAAASHSVTREYPGLLAAAVPLR
jgi:hypothetical protein